MNGHLIPDTPIAVDFWKIRKCGSASIFFLSHIHSDHTVGLTSSWSQRIYCSKTTGDLLMKKFCISEDLIKPMELNSPVLIPLNPSHTEMVTVTAVDANHCPGSVMFLFQGYFGTILYTGDFRYDAEMFNSPPLNSVAIDTLYLDNTYCDPACDFGSRQAMTDEIIKIIQSYPDHDILLGMQSIGKPDLLINIAKTFKEYIGVPASMYEYLEVLEMPNLFQVDTPEHECRVRVIPAYRVSARLFRSLTRPSIAILTTALYVGLGGSPFTNLNSIFVVPYSDHSSFVEIEEFVRQIKPKRIVPIVGREAKGPFNISFAPRADMSRFEPLLSKRPQKVFTIPEGIDLKEVRSACDTKHDLLTGKTKQKRKSLNFKIAKLVKPKTAIVFENSPPRTKKNLNAVINGSSSNTLDQSKTLLKESSGIKLGQAELDKTSFPEKYVSTRGEKVSTGEKPAYSCGEKLSTIENTISTHEKQPPHSKKILHTHVEQISTPKRSIRTREEKPCTPKRSPCTRGKKLSTSKKNASSHEEESSTSKRSTYTNGEKVSSPKRGTCTREEDPSTPKRSTYTREEKLRNSPKNAHTHDEETITPKKNTYNRVVKLGTPKKNTCTCITKRSTCICGEKLTSPKRKEASTSKRSVCTRREKSYHLKKNAPSYRADKVCTEQKMPQILRITRLTSKRLKRSNRKKVCPSRKVIRLPRKKALTSRRTTHAPKKKAFAVKSTECSLMKESSISEQVPQEEGVGSLEKSSSTPEIHLVQAQNRIADCSKRKLLDINKKMKDSFMNEDCCEISLDLTDTISFINTTSRLSPDSNSNSETLISSPDSQILPENNSDPSNADVLANITNFATHSGFPTVNPRSDQPKVSDNDPELPKNSEVNENSEKDSSSTTSSLSIVYNIEPSLQVVHLNKQGIQSQSIQRKCQLTSTLDREFCSPLKQRHSDNCDPSLKRSKSLPHIRTRPVDRYLEKKSPDSDLRTGRNRYFLFRQLKCGAQSSVFTCAVPDYFGGCDPQVSHCGKIFSEFVRKQRLRYKP